ncbi:putative OB-fold protein [Litorivivens lipolytica]|uniref:Putative OB-fold protein n=1 Tax=Litorivivens lipolytica TaxID=1524264 RepID=A0A7W4W3T6_9GAMM|nr:hypothetical protein [Litorivivens lipolytica]MBB3046930.1 putative OB-fold protein [Litorivivens lipolytica]
MSEQALIQTFWQAASRGELITCCCRNCRIDIWYPEASCPSCGEHSSWRPLGDRARLLSWTQVQRQINGAFEVPYMPAIVIPDDAPDVQLVTQLFLSEGVAPACDMPLQLHFRELKPLDGEAFMAPVYSEVNA